MKTQRFIGNFELNKGVVEVSDPDAIHQILKVFRLRKGDLITLCDGNGREAPGIIKEIKSKSLLVRVSEVKTYERPENQRYLLCSILKKENFELVCQKATEIGVSNIIPIISSRTVKLELRRDRLEKIVKEAAEQSDKVFLPQLADPINFTEAIIMDFDLKYILDQRGKRELIKADVKKTAILIGPEGGWTDEEIKEAQFKGWQEISISDFTLRAETAAIIGAYTLVGK